jgi:hypothetical protein
MASFDIIRFDVREGVGELDFRAVDEAMQHWCYLNRPGIQRRTTARDGRHCIVVHLFDGPEHCGTDYLSSHDDAVRRWTGMIEESTLTHEVYSLL